MKRFLILGLTHLTALAAGFDPRSAARSERAGSTCGIWCESFSQFITAAKYR